MYKCRNRKLEDCAWVNIEIQMMRRLLNPFAERPGVFVLQFIPGHTEGVPGFRL